METVGLAEVPSTFHLQARVSQAKLPIGEGLFKDVVVRVMRGNDELCAEGFEDVRVVNGVMNLEIGAQMTCNLNDVVGRRSELSLVVCPGSPSTCLPAIPLASTGYAVKASWAQTADRAWRVERAAQANYAHRVAADDAVATRRATGVGYTEFTTPTAAEAAALYDAAGFAPYANGGFLQWTPTRYPDAQSLTVAARTYGGALGPLDAVHFVSKTTRIEGVLSVAPPPGAPGSTLTVAGGGLHVASGHLTLGGALLVSDGLSISSGGLEIAAGGLSVTGASTLSGSSSLGTGPLTVSGGLHAGGASSATGALLISSGELRAVSLTIGNSADFGASLNTGAATMGSRLEVAGSVRFKGPVTFEVGHAEPDLGPDGRYVLAGTESRDLSFSSTVTVGGALSLTGTLDLGGGTVRGWRAPAHLSAPIPCGPTTQGAVYFSLDSGGIQTCIGDDYRPLTYRVCGDGLAVPGEQCDDGNVDPGDGCSPTCVTE